ncbi:unnamed protein product [Prorocentrum cordatum]|uniref:Band 7 domain-containing protein n=1 Tax=Prorocentrum cordatum TaxID=2364126 RepID=A0ABN9TWQ7_9DINO|nr:unnamed protein product [Polarella glacialis]
MRRDRIQSVHSRCVQQDVSRISDAVSKFSEKGERGEIPLVLIPAHRSPFSGTGWWLTIPTGCYCLMQRFGKDVGLAPPGGSLKPPFYRIAYIVTQQSCTYNAPVLECPTSDNVRVSVDMVITFMIRDPSKFVYKLGGPPLPSLCLSPSPSLHLSPPRVLKPVGLVKPYHSLPPRRNSQGRSATFQPRTRILLLILHPCLLLLSSPSLRCCALRPAADRGRGRGHPSPREEAVPPDGQDAPREPRRQHARLSERKFAESGVVFSNCTVTAVVLPEELEQSLETTTAMRKAMEKTTREHEFEMGEIQRKSQLELEGLKRNHEQAIVREHGNKKMAELNRDNGLVKAAELLSTARIEAEQQAQVLKMETTAKRDRTRVDMERARVEQISKAEADAETRRVQADISYEKALMNAEVEKQRFVGEAEAIKLDSQAEAKASQYLTHKRKHELEMREKDVIMRLAQKANYNLVGAPGDRLVDGMMEGTLAEGGAAAQSGWFR